MREIADAPSPMGVNLKTQASDLHGHALRGAIFAGQPLRPDTTYEVLQLIEYQTVPTQRHRICYPWNSSSLSLPQGVLPQGVQCRRLIGDHRPGFLHSFGSRQHQIAAMEPILPQACIAAVCRRGKIPQAFHLVKRRFTEMGPKLCHFRGIAPRTVQQHVALATVSSNANGSVVTNSSVHDWALPRSASSITSLWMT